MEVAGGGKRWMGAGAGQGGWGVRGGDVDGGGRDKVDGGNRKAVSSFQLIGRQM